MNKDDRDYYLYLRDRRITGNEYYPRVCSAYGKALWEHVFVSSFRVSKRSMNALS